MKQTKILLFFILLLVILGSMVVSFLTIDKEKIEVLTESSILSNQLIHIQLAQNQIIEYANISFDNARSKEQLSRTVSRLEILREQLKSEKYQEVFYGLDQLNNPLYSEQEINVLSRINTDLEKLKTAKVKDVSALNAQYSDYQTQLIVIQSVLAILALIIVGYMVFIANPAAQSTIDALRSRTNQLVRERNELEIQVNSKNDELDSKAANLKKAAKIISTNKHQIKKLMIDRNSLLKNQKNRLQKASLLQKSHNLKNQEIQRSEQQLSKSNALIQDYKSQLNESESGIAVMKKELAELLSSKERKEEEIIQVGRELQKLKAEHDEVHEENGELREIYGKLEDDAAGLSEQINQMEEQIDLQEISLKRGEVKLQQVEEKYQNLNQENQHLKVEFRAIEHNLKENKKKNLQVQKQLDSKELQLNSLKDVNEQLGRENKELNESFNTIQHQLDANKSELLERGELLTKLESENINKENRLRELEEHLRNSKKELLQKGQEYDELKSAQIKSIKAESEELKNKFQSVSPLDLGVSDSILEEGIWDYNIEEDSFVVSNRLKDILGYNGNNPIKSFDTFLDHVHPNEKSRVKEYFDYSIINGTSSIDIQCRLKTSDGDFIWTENRGALERDEALKAKRIIGSTQDISEEVKREQFLKQLSSFANLTDTSVFISNSQGNVLWSNDAAKELFISYEIKSSIKKIDQLFTNGLDSSYLLQLKEVIKGRQAFESEVLLHPAEDEKWAVLSVQPVDNEFDDGDSLILIKDISEVKKQSQELDKMLAIVQSTDDFIVEVDKSQQIVWTNNRFESEVLTLLRFKGKSFRKFLDQINLESELLEEAVDGDGVDAGVEIADELHLWHIRSIVQADSTMYLIKENTALENALSRSEQLSQLLHKVEMPAAIIENDGRVEWRNDRFNDINPSTSRLSNLFHYLKKQNQHSVYSELRDALAAKEWGECTEIEIENKEGNTCLYKLFIHNIGVVREQNFYAVIWEDQTEVLEFRKTVEIKETEIENLLAKEKDFQEELALQKSNSEELRSQISSLEERSDILDKIPSPVLLLDRYGIVKQRSEASRAFFENDPFNQSLQRIDLNAYNLLQGFMLNRSQTEDYELVFESGSSKYVKADFSSIDRDGEHFFLLIYSDQTEARRLQHEISDSEKTLREIMDEQFKAQETLLEKEEQLKEALENARNLSLVASKTENAVIITDRNGNIEWINEGFTRITEYTFQEVVGKKPGSILQGPDTRDEDRLRIREGLASKRPFSHEIYNYSKSGRGYWLQLSITPVFDENGQIEKFIAIESDITEQKEREEELFNLSLVASKTDNAIIISSRDGLIEYVNEGFERITGYSRHEVMGKKPGSFLQGPDTNPEHVQAIRRGLKSKKPFKQEILNYSKNGQPYWLQLSISPILDEYGQVKQFIAIESDITEQKNEQSVLENLSLVASKTDNAVIITNAAGEVEWVNDGFTKITEYSFDEVKGKKPGVLLQGPDTKESDRAAIRRGLASKKPFKQEIYNYTKSGKGYWLELAITPVFDEIGELDKFIAIENDVTERKAYEGELMNLSLVASKTDNAVIITNREGLVEWVNEGFERVTEYSLAEVVGKKPAAFLQGPETREEDIQAIRKGLNSGLPFTQEIYNYSKSGRGYWLQLSVTPIFDEEGNIDKFIAIESDITEQKLLEDEIKDSENQMRTIMDQQFAATEDLMRKEKELNMALDRQQNLALVAAKTDNAVIISDKDGKIQFVNDGFEKITGYKDSEVLGRKPGNFLQGPETDPAHIKAIRAGLNSKKPFTQEILNYSKHGKPYWLSISMTPILDSEGEVEKFIAVETDITERKTEEEILKNLSLVASKTDNAVIITDSNGLIEWVNEGFEKITEYRFDEVIGKKPGDFLQGEKTKDEDRNRIREGLEAGKPFSHEIYNYSKSGRGYWLSLSISPIFTDDGELERFIAIESDISERKALEEEMQEAEESLRGIMDKQFEAQEKLIKQEEALKKSIEEQASKQIELEEATNRLKETQSQMVQSEKMASVGQLTAGIAHEINNPINFVYNGIDSLKMSLDDLTQIIHKYDELAQISPDQMLSKLAEIEEFKKKMRYSRIMQTLPDVITDIKTGANRTIEIVKGLRVFSRLDEEEQKAANVNEGLESTLILLRNKTKDKIKVRKFMDSEIQDIMCYPGQLNQVFMNLISNAIQAIPDERNDGELQIYTENLEKQIIIRVLDNGSGIPEDVQKRIFEPFYTTKPVGIGTGLGLSISFGIIEKHNGKIYVNSEEGKGTEFVIELPKEQKLLS